MRRENSKLRTSVYRKPVHTDRLLDQCSYHPTCHKATSVRTLTRRAHLVCDSRNSLSRETKHLQPHGNRVAHKPITTLRQLLTNVKDKVEPKDRQEAVYKIKCCDCPATYVGETGRNLNTRLTEHRRATKNGDNKNNIAEHHLQTDHRIDWDSAECISFSTDYYQRLTLESWFTNLEQCQQLPASYKRLINNKQNKLHKQTNQTHD